MFSILFSNEKASQTNVALFFYLYKNIHNMKLKIKQSILKGDKRYNEGDVIELDANTAKNWIKKGLGSKISKKKEKQTFETKELKVEYKEIKSDETN
tara:strand:+ start:36 stop:326 length:291 start_codon:yes stop_codon:yes gene_type:complete